MLFREDEAFPIGDRREKGLKMFGKKKELKLSSIKGEKMKKEIHDNLIAFICFLSGIILTIIYLICRLIGQKMYHLSSLFAGGLGANLFYNDPVGLISLICSVISGGLFCYAFCYIFSKYRKIVNLHKYLLLTLCVICYAVLLVSSQSLLFDTTSLVGLVMGLFFAAKDSPLTEKEKERYKIMKASMIANKTGVIQEIKKESRNQNGH